MRSPARRRSPACSVSRTPCSTVSCHSGSEQSRKSGRCSTRVRVRPVQRFVRGLFFFRLVIGMCYGRTRSLGVRVCPCASIHYIPVYCTSESFACGCEMVNACVGAAVQSEPNAPRVPHSYLGLARMWVGWLRVVSRVCLHSTVVSFIIRHFAHTHQRSPLPGSCRRIGAIYSGVCDIFLPENTSGISCRNSGACERHRFSD